MSEGEKSTPILDNTTSSLVLTPQSLVVIVVVIVVGPYSLCKSEGLITATRIGWTSLKCRGSSISLIKLNKKHDTAIIVVA